jgi:arylsulfatase A-like enzyme
MVRWPAKIKPGVSDALVCQIDLTASFASLVGQENTTPDSENILDAFIGKSNQGRKNLILGQSGITTYRKGDYILIPPHKGPKINNRFVNNETGRDLNMLLYNIKEDKNQQKNLAEKHPEMITTMLKEIETIQNKQ